MIQYSKEEVIEKLKTARNLLDAVYHWANESENMELVESSMSCADGCIYDALEFLENE